MSQTKSYPVQKVELKGQSVPDHNRATTDILGSGPGVVIPAPGVVPQLADDTAPDGAVYFSTTRNALVFRDVIGAVHLISTTNP